MQRQPDPLQPDDQHELQAAARGGCDEARGAAGGEGSDAEQRELEHRLGHPAFDQDEGDQQGRPPTIEAITVGFVQPMAWPP